MVVYNGVGFKTSSFDSQFDEQKISETTITKSK